MAITTLAGAIAGIQPPSFFNKGNANGGGSTAITFRGSTNYFFTGSLPVVAAVPSAGMAGVALTSQTGMIDFRNPASGNSYLFNFKIGSGDPLYNIMLIDRLWEQSGIAVTTTTAQTVNSVAWPARDTAQSTNGAGVYIGVQITSNLGAAFNLGTIITYTNSAGAGSRTGTLQETAGGNNAPAFWVFALDSGDIGVRSIQSITLVGSLVSGTIHLFAFRPIFFMSASDGLGASAQVPTYNHMDPLRLGFPQMFDNTVMQLTYLNGSTCPMSGQVTYTQG